MKLAHVIAVAFALALALAFAGSSYGKNSCRGGTAYRHFGWNLNCTGSCDADAESCSVSVRNDGQGNLLVCACSTEDGTGSPYDPCCQLAEREIDGSVVLSTVGDCISCGLSGKCKVFLDGDEAQSTCVN